LGKEDNRDNEHHGRPKQGDAQAASLSALIASAVYLDEANYQQGGGQCQKPGAIGSSPSKGAG
jgi:hypothetical protein